MMIVKIRDGTEKDLTRVLQLVQELAAYEKAADQVKADIVSYQRGFADGDFQTIVAEFQDQIMGMALYYLTWSTWRGRMLYLEDLVVTDQARGQGIGQQLLDAFLNKAKELECTMVKWQVLDWNEPAIAFYEKQGATIEKDWWNVKVIF